MCKVTVSRCSKNKRAEVKIKKVLKIVLILAVILLVLGTAAFYCIELSRYE